MDALAALRLQIGWGADEALADAPLDRLRPTAPPRAAPALAVAATAPPRGQAAVSRATALARQADTIEALREAVRGFDGCALRDTASNLVFPEGGGASGLMLIGDTPGEAEDRSGRPFTGPAGAYLDRMLDSIGLGRAEVLAGLVVPWRPPGGRPASEAEIACCLPFMLRYLALARPRRLLLLGSAAARALLPSGLRRVPRGEWLAVAVPELEASLPAFPTTSPATLLDKPAERRRAWADLRVLKRALDADLTRS